MKTGFGWIKLGGRTYEHDIIIHVDGSVSRRKKRLSKQMKGDYGHTPLSEHELEFLADERPEVVYIGTGHVRVVTPHSRCEGDPVGPILPLSCRPGTSSLSLEAEERPFAAILHITC